MLWASLEGVQGRPSFRTLSVEHTLQRLFSTFPDRWPGFGLLLLRLGIGITLVWNGCGGILIMQNAIEVVAGVFLLAGLWTPVMGAVAAVDQIWIALSVPAGGFPVLLAVLSVSLAMLGPGVWSIDARLFGRRRFRNPL
jgi:putative oxidoreductase